MSIYKCSVCETVFDETNEGKKWDQLPGDWTCDVCESGKFFWRIADDTSASDISGDQVEVAADAESVPEKMSDGYNHPGSCTQETVGDRLCRPTLGEFFKGNQRGTKRFCPTYRK